MEDQPDHRCQTTSAYVAGAHHTLRRPWLYLDLICAVPCVPPSAKVATGAEDALLLASLASSRWALLGSSLSF